MEEIQTSVCIAPLEWPREWTQPTDIQRFLRGTPYIGQEHRVHKVLSAQLAARGLAYREMWRSIRVSESAWSHCSRLISDRGLWPSDRFIPDDPFQIVMFDLRGDGLPVVELLLDLEDYFQLDRGSVNCESYEHLTYGAFLEHIAGGATPS